MDVLIKHIASEYGLPEEKVRRAVAAQLSLIKTTGGTHAASKLLAAVPGAEALAASAAAEGGLLGKMAGGMMGGPLASVSRMQGLGLSVDQGRIITTALVDHLKQDGRGKIVREAIANIPGLSGYL
jgi:hypothetical protein